jgi:hypothetical protein
MGLSIHYKGKLRDKASLPMLIEEVADIAKIHKWKHRVLEPTFPINPPAKEDFNELYGICFTPPECETMSICFLSTGQLVSVGTWYLFSKGSFTKKELLEYPVSVKTQFAGEVTHKIIIHLMDYISKKYLSHFEMMDEGEYWETRNEKLLHEKFTLLNKMIEKVGSAIKGNLTQPGESIEAYFERVRKDIHSQNKSSQ